MILFSEKNVVEFITLPALIFASYLGLSVYTGWDTMVFERIDAPSTITSKGFTPDVLRMRLLSEMDDIRRTAGSRLRDVKLDQSINEGLQEVGKALNLSVLYSATQSIINVQRLTVSGHFTEVDKDVILTMHVTQRDGKTFLFTERGNRDQVPEIMQRAAFNLIKILDPYLAALYMRSVETRTGDLGFPKTLALIDHCFKVLPPHDFEYPLNLWGRVLFFQGKYEESLPKYEAALQVRSNLTVAHVNLARSLNRLKRFEEAHQHSERAIDIGGEDQIAYVELAIALTGLGRVDDAIDAYGHAAKLSPRNVELQVEYANALLRAGRSADAKAALARAIEFDPMSPRLKAELDAVR